MESKRLTLFTSYNMDRASCCSTSSSIQDCTGGFAPLCCLRYETSGGPQVQVLEVQAGEKEVSICCAMCIATASLLTAEFLIQVYFCNKKCQQVGHPVHKHVCEPLDRLEFVQDVKVQCFTQTMQHSCR